MQEKFAKEETEGKKLQVTKRVNELQKKYKILAVILVLAIIMPIIAISTYVNASTTNILTPEENQYLELKATTIAQKEDGSKQLIMELWGHNLEFKRF